MQSSDRIDECKGPFAGPPSSQSPALKTEKVQNETPCETYAEALPAKAQDPWLRTRQRHPCLIPKKFPACSANLDPWMQNNTSRGKKMHWRQLYTIHFVQLLR